MRRRDDGSADKARALVLSPEAPYPPVGGGAMRTASLIQYLAARYETDLIVFREPGASNPKASIPAGLLRATLVLELPVHGRGSAARTLRNLRRLLLGVPPLNDRFHGFEAPIRQWLQDRRYELAVVEHFWCAPYARLLRSHADHLVLDLHNVESELHAGLARTEPLPSRWAHRRFAGCCRRLEDRWLREFSAVVTASEEDAARVRAIAPGTPTAVYPNAIPLVPQPRVPEQEAIVFSGNLEYPPNVAAVRFFRREVWPLLRARRPRLVWWVFGKNPQGVARYLRGDPQIELIGPVEDAMGILAAAQVVVAPVLAASGTRFKILEAWAAGRAVVSTTIGAEGLGARHGEHLLLADEARSFAAAVAALLDSPERRRALGQAGRSLYERCFCWEAAWTRLREVGI